MTTEIPRKHVCKHCLKSFKRSEHCARHVRAHTREKPFACQYCHKSYSRKDLVVRHERTLHAEEHARIQSRTAEHQNQDANDANAILSPSYKSQDSAIEADEDADEDSDIIVVNYHHKPASSTEIISMPTTVSSSIPPNQTLPAQQLLDGFDGCGGARAHPAVQSDVVQTAQPTLQETDVVSYSFVAPTSLSVNNPDLAQDMPLDDVNYQSQDLVLMEGILMETDIPNLDFFDPFLGNTYDNFALPALPDSTEFLSPFETRSDYDQNTNSDTNARLGITERHSQTRTRDTTHSHRQIPATFGSRSADMLSRGLGEGVGSLNPQIRTLSYDEDAHTHLWADLCSRLDASNLGSFKLPSVGLMRKWLRVYVDAFHVHFPFIHLSTLDLRTNPSPLTLAICAIGALYRLNRSAAAALHVKAVQALDVLEVNVPKFVLEQKLLQDWTRPKTRNESVMRRPLWQSQARLLSTIFATFSGDPLVVRKSFQDLGLLSSDYRMRLMQLKPNSSDRRLMSWNQWVERESAKRFLHMTFIFSNLANITYGGPPGFCLSQDGMVEMPGDEALWQAQTEQLWQQLVKERPQNEPISLRDAAGAIVSSEPVEELVDLLGAWSAFGTSVAIHAVCTQIWHIDQGVVFERITSGRSTPDDKGYTSILAKKTQAALNRCRNLLMEVHNEQDHLSYDTESPLLFNSFAILRVSFSRAFTSVGLVNREMLLYENSDEMVSAIHDYVLLPQERSEFTTKSISRSFEGIVIPFQSSPLFVRKTAALTWSIEHALAGWDAALLVTKWVFAMEVLQKKGASITESERETLGKIRSLIEEEEYDGSDILLSSSLARLWAGFYDDTWVWGVTPRIGWVLRELGNAYETVSET